MRVSFDAGFPQSVRLSPACSGRRSGGLGCLERHGAELLWSWRISSRFSLRNFPRLDSDAARMRLRYFITLRKRRYTDSTDLGVPQRISVLVIFVLEG